MKKLLRPFPMCKHGAFKLILASLGAAALLSACGGTKEQYYRLTSAGPAVTKTTGRAVAIGPVILPAYVDRAELVFQNGPNLFEIPAKVRWAGALQENFAQVLASDVGQRLGSGNVAANPAPGDTRFRYRVSVMVRQFHAMSGQGAILDVAWRVEDASTRQVLRNGNGSFNSAIHGDGYAPVIAAESDLVEQLAAAICRSL